MTEKGRLQWVDAARGFGILLVVVGHVNGGLVSAGLASGDGVFRAIEDWLYSFHMPLFFLLSGLFAGRRTQTPLPQFFVDLLRTIAYPYLLWSALQTSLQIGLSGATNHPADPSLLWWIPVNPPMQFWFLYALFVISSAYRLLATYVRSPVLLFAISLGCALLERALPDGTWQVAREALTFFPYFALGTLVLPSLDGLQLSRPMLAGLTLALFVGLTAVVSGFGRTGPTSATGALAATLGIGGSLALAFLVAQTRAESILVAWGRASLPIYVAHTLASAGLRIVLLKIGVRDLATHLALGIVGGMALPFILSRLVDRFEIHFVFSWPKRTRPRQAAPS